jgi:hypothetical protein
MELKLCTQQSTRWLTRTIIKCAFGRTNQTAVQRLKHHLYAAKRGNPRPVYAWIRFLRPAQPVLVILQENIEVQDMSRGKGHNVLGNPAFVAQAKWLKRFERCPLLCEIPHHTKAYRHSQTHSAPSLTQVAQASARHTLQPRNAMY